MKTFNLDIIMWFAIQGVNSEFTPFVLRDHQSKDSPTLTCLYRKKWTPHSFKFITMDNVREINGQWHVKVGKNWKMRSNFVFKILYEVQHPQDSVYVVNVTRDGGTSG